MIAASDATTNLAMALAACTVLGWVLLGARLERWWVTAPMAFTLLGLMAGDDALDMVDFRSSSEAVELLAELTLVMVLFTDAAKVGGQGLRHVWGGAGRILAIGLPLTVVFGTFVGLWLVPGAHWTTVALAAAVLAPTDAALGHAVVASPSVPERVRNTLSVESGMNDGLIVPIATVLFALARADEGSDDLTSWLRFAIEQIGFGALAGAVAGLTGAFIAGRCLAAGWADTKLLGVGQLALAFMAWALAESMGGNGLIAAFVAGIAVVARGAPLRGDDVAFIEQEGQLFVWLTFFAFGGLLVGPALGEADGRSLLYVAASLTIVRMVPVAVSLFGSGTPPLTVGFVGWFGPRGLASIAIALQALLATDSPVGVEFATVVSLTVFASTMLHGLSARPAAELIGPRLSDPAS